MQGVHGGEAVFFGECECFFPQGCAEGLARGGSFEMFVVELDLGLMSFEGGFWKEFQFYGVGGEKLPVLVGHDG